MYAKSCEWLARMESKTVNWLEYLIRLLTRVGFFPFAVAGLLITVGFRGAMAIVVCGLLLHALGFVRSP